MMVLAYLKENIDDNVNIKHRQNQQDIPVFLRNRYDFHDMEVLQTKCILVEIIDDIPAIDQLLKHLKHIETLTGGPIVLLSKGMSPYRRKSLIKQRISFIIEDGQMYLPFLALDLKRTAITDRDHRKSFSTSAQIAFLYYLYHSEDVLNVTEFAAKMAMTKMTASRALNDLHQAGLVTYYVGGKTKRSKRYQRISDPQYFRKARPLLKSPVNKTVHVTVKPNSGLIAGYDALAQLSMLNLPDHPTLAISPDKYEEIVDTVIENRDLVKDIRPIEVQRWDYDPVMFSETFHVDLLSLYASLKDDMDERISQALEQVLRGELWYTD